MKPFHTAWTARIILWIGLASAVPGALAQGTIRWGTDLLKRPADFYKSADAGKVADSVLQYQSPQGGWPKSTDLAKPPRSPDDIPRPGSGRANSLDNEATTLPMAFLARVATATGEARYQAAFVRGLDYLLAAQYSSGGWPQFWPLRDGYYSRITYNDGAMIRAMTILRDVAEGRPPYAFVDEGRRARAAASVERGIDCILKTQVTQDGKRTAWCAQHHEKTLEPAWARAYEPPSLSGGESVGIVRFLMGIEEPDEEIVAAIEGAVAWFKAVVIHGKRQERVRRDDGRVERVLVDDPDASPLWARFYELGTNRPLYLDRDSVFRYNYEEISDERRSGYSYHGTWAGSLIEKDYPKWRVKHGRP